jgi:hypothetical protein
MTPQISGRVMSLMVKVLYYRNIADSGTEGGGMEYAVITGNAHDKIYWFINMAGLVRRRT